MEVQVCSLRSPDFERKFRQSLLETGFAVVTHHGIDHGLIREVQTAWKSFFNEDFNYKREFVDTNDSNMGYTGFGGERAVGATTHDLKEFYHWKPGYRLPTNLVNLTQKLYSLLEGDIAGQLLHALCGFGSEMDYAEVCQGSENTLLRTLYYPALAECDANEGAVRAAAHEDINFLTLLIAASAAGLEVQDRSGKWHKVPHEENSIVVNIGDSLQLASGGLLKSTTHRVVNPDNTVTDRISMPLFVHPRPDTMLAPGVTAQQYLNERLSTIYSGGYGK